MISGETCVGLCRPETLSTILVECNSNLLDCCCCIIQHSPTTNTRLRLASPILIRFSFKLKFLHISGDSGQTVYVVIQFGSRDHLNYREHNVYWLPLIKSLKGFGIWDNQTQYVDHWIEDWCHSGKVTIRLSSNSLWASRNWMKPVDDEKTGGTKKLLEWYLFLFTIFCSCIHN